MYLRFQRRQCSEQPLQAGSRQEVFHRNVFVLFQEPASQVGQIESTQSARQFRHRKMLCLVHIFSSNDTVCVATQGCLESW